MKSIAKLLDENFFHGGNGRSEAVDAKFLAVLFEHSEQFLKVGAAIVWQQIVQLRPHTRFLLHVGYVLANNTSDVLLFAFTVLHQS